ncbi:isochorismatase family protein [Amycolatopsis jejuensis]|uniref:isochorismatase family protein n=1 Tax=Amycolatopsis jejuensis TaxID=330084 RepID=UPI00068DE6FA|nr:isochorismatase family protein [Amycolatopsis jejuensis]
MSDNSAAIPGARWDEFLTAGDKALRDRVRWGARVGLGSCPAVLVVDVLNGFCAPADDAETARDEFPLHTGDTSQAGVEGVRKLLDGARSAGVPVLYSRTRATTGLSPGRGRWADKNPDLAEETEPASQIVADVAPVTGDIVFTKDRPSAFFGTDLPAYLIELGVDSLVVCGTTTSGCVRATVTDAFSYNYRVAVALEATFDRYEAAHWLNLFDMDQKFADVMTVDAILASW